MSPLAITIFVCIGMTLFVLSLGLRAWTDSKYEIRAIDVALALVPFCIWLVMTGRIKKLAIGGFEVEAAEAIRTAAATSVEQQVSFSDPLTIDEVVEHVDAAAKGAVSEIPRLIRRKIEALEFVLGKGGYYGPAIARYFDALGAHPYLKYIILRHDSGRLFGILKAREFIAFLQEQGQEAYEEFAQRTNDGGTESLEWLARLPGFIDGKHAATPDADKKSVLEKMEHLETDSLPVVDSNGRFGGMIDRARITASLIIDIANRLEHR